MERREKGRRDGEVVYFGTNGEIPVQSRKVLKRNQPWGEILNASTKSLSLLRGRDWEGKNLRELRSQSMNSR